MAHEIWAKTNTAIVVVTVDSMGDNYIEDYAVRLFETWGIGKKGEDKGVLILNTIKEQEIRIETGYGVEGILPDGLLGTIRDQYLIPHLREGDFGGGHVSPEPASGLLKNRQNSYLFSKQSKYALHKRGPAPGWLNRG